MEAIPLCLPVSKSHLFSLSQQIFSLVQIVAFTLFYMFRSVLCLPFLFHWIAWGYHNTCRNMYPMCGWYN